MKTYVKATIGRGGFSSERYWIVDGIEGKQARGLANEQYVVDNTFKQLPEPPEKTVVLGLLECRILNVVASMYTEDAAALIECPTVPGGGPAPQIVVWSTDIVVLPLDFLTELCFIDRVRALQIIENAN